MAATRAAESAAPPDDGSEGELPWLALILGQETARSEPRQTGAYDGCAGGWRPREPGFGRGPPGVVRTLDRGPGRQPPAARVHAVPTALAGWTAGARRTG